ncbi:MAG: site-2 protease family protein [Planctomycetota bacterium]
MSSEDLHGETRQGEIVFDDGFPPPTSETLRAMSGRPVYRPRKTLPLLLFVATCVSTWFAGGWVFSLALMFTLLAHEFGHYLQAVRYGVPASLPFFIPMPISPIGTMGAVIAMQPGKGDRKELYDIAISGPLAGFFPAVVFSIIGLQLSEVQPIPENQLLLMFGEPLFYQWLVQLTFGTIPDGHDVILHPLAFAGWVGLFITALNLFPIGQLDGGHILYALVGKHAHLVARLFVIGAIAGVLLGGYYGWSVMLTLLLLMGINHPPTANDDVPLGTTRTVLGWIALAFMPLGFTPTPFSISG